MSTTVQTIAAPHVAGRNAIVVQLLEEALALFERDHATARRRIEDAFALAQFTADGASSRKGMLAGWQVRRVTQYIRDNLSTRLRIEDAAKIAKLSDNYFSRAFKVTIGMSYSKYVAQARIDLAMRLLLTTDDAVSHIALECGLADQSHLTRLFARVVGLPPCAWRRQMKSGEPEVQLPRVA